MANENMEEWRVSARVIDETVKVAKEYLEKHPEEVKKHETRLHGDNPKSIKQSPAMVCTGSVGSGGFIHPAGTIIPVRFPAGLNYRGAKEQHISFIALFMRDIYTTFPQPKFLLA